MCNPKGRNYQRLVDEGMVASPMALKSRFDKDGTEAIRQQLAKKNYEVIHAYNPRALACGLRASRGTDIKIVAYRGVIGNISFLNPESWITFLHPRVSKIVCVADAIKDYLASLRFCGCTSLSASFKESTRGTIWTGISRPRPISPSLVFPKVPSWCAAPDGIPHEKASMT